MVETSPTRIAPPAKGAAEAFMQGAGLALSGFGFLGQRPRLWKWVLIPVAINVVLFAAAIGSGIYGMINFSSKWMAGHSDWFWAPVILIQVILCILSLIAVYFIFTPVALLIAAPFNDKLAEKTERACGMSIPEDSGLRRLLGDVLFALANESRRLLFFGLGFLLLFGLNLIPLIGSGLYAVAAFYWASRGLAFEFISYAADRRRMTWREKLNLLRSHWTLTMGFGTTVAVLLLVPFLNVLMVPLCAIGGTQLFAVMTGGENRDSHSCADA